MDKVLEELLEAIWSADEEGQSSLDAIRTACPIEVQEADLDALNKRDFIAREGNRVTLTYAGREQARTIVRRHRLAETLFASVLDIHGERQHALACEAEHLLLPEVTEGICTLLGHPTSCPHAKPIPPGPCCDAQRTVATSVVTDLASLAPGDKGRITYIKPKSHSRLHRLTSFGLTPGTVVHVHQCSPAFCIRYEGTELALDQDVASDIYVAKIE